MVVRNMSVVKEAVVQRLKSICKDRGIAANELANLSGVTPSTVYSLLYPERKNASITTIKILCDGLDMTLSEFFSSPEFDDLEQEIK
jgi:transcriptional regulator with XRE-family HTH domain